MWKLTILQLNSTEAALLRHYAENGGADCELMEILCSAYLNYRGRSRELAMTSLLRERILSYERGTLNKEGGSLAREIFGRVLDEIQEPVNFQMICSKS